MKNFTVVLCSIFLSLITLGTYADSWPIFLPPDLRLLSTTHNIDASTCPPGQGKLMDHVSINIQSYLCKNFCPPSWEWVTSSDNTCHDLISDFFVQNVDIARYEDSDGTTSYSKITVYYGQKAGNHPPVNKIIYTSAPHDHWYCMEIDPKLHNFTCANDI